MRVVAIAVVWLGAAAAAADPGGGGDHVTHVLFDLPIDLGVTTAGGAGFQLGLRPELTFARLEAGGERGFGVAVYGELAGDRVRDHSTGLLGAGIAVVGYRDGLALAPSVGLFRRVDDPAHDDGVSVGVFFGLRQRDEILPWSDLPIGVRIDANLGAHASSVVVSAQFDLQWIAYPVVLMVEVAEAVKRGG
jgi:hypothetical protein